MEAFSIGASVASVAIAVLAIWLSVKFYQMSAAASDRANASAKEISSAVARLEKLFDRLYADTFSIMQDTVTDMRRHMWPVDPVPDSAATVDQRTEEKVRLIGDELTAKLDDVVQRSGVTSARLEELTSELKPMIEEAIARATSAGTEARQESLRTLLLDTFSARYDAGKRVPANFLVTAHRQAFPLREILDELRALKSEGVLDFDNELLPDTTIRRKT